MNLFSLAILAILFVIPTPGIAKDAAPSTKCYELRTYHVNKGRMETLNTLFKDHFVDLWTKHGIEKVGYWTTKDKDLLIYMLAFPSRDAAKTMWENFYADPIFKKEIKAAQKGGKLLSKVESVYMMPTDYSPAIKASTEKTPRLFELRTYTTNTGKLKDLNSRFRDHTKSLFTNHGLNQFGYWTPMDDDKGAKNKMIYILTHKDEASRKANFKAFGKDPKWKSARKASVANGPILVPKGVKSVLMVPTDYSPSK